MLTKESQINVTVFTAAVLVFSLMAVFSSPQIQADIRVDGKASKALTKSAQ
jgi:hypothetical protein